jgi:photosystem II stability/assembly factor-like uncharacterized protein
MKSQRLRSLNCLTLIGVLLAASSVSRTKAGTNSWTTNGPSGGQISALLIDPIFPATLYAATQGLGVFKSTNGGGSWNAVNTGFTTPDINSLAIDPANPSTLFAGTTSGVFKSTNGGGSWNTVNTGLTNTLVTALAIDPTTPATIYAGTLGIDTPGFPTFGGVFKSTNGGGEWDEVLTLSSTNTMVSRLAVDPISPMTVYAGTSGPPFGEMWKSTDGGVSWNPINNGIPNFPVTALVIDPINPATLYAGTSLGVFKTTNRGGNWSDVNVGLTNINVQALAVDPATPGTLYAGTHLGGVFKSTTGGGSWSAVNTGLTNRDVTALAIDPSTPTTVHAGTWGSGVFTNNMVSAPPCPVAVAVSDRGNAESIMRTLYRLRDEVMLPSPDKRRYAELFYGHSMEGSWILLANSELRSRVAGMLSRFLPTFKAVIEGRRATLKAGDVRDIDALIQAFMAKSGLALRADLQRIRGELRDGSLLKRFGIQVGLD